MNSQSETIIARKQQELEKGILSLQKADLLDGRMGSGGNVARCIILWLFSLFSFFSMGYKWIWDIK